MCAFHLRLPKGAVNVSAGNWTIVLRDSVRVSTIAHGHACGRGGVAERSARGRGRDEKPPCHLPNPLACADDPENRAGSEFQEG